MVLMPLRRNDTSGSFQTHWSAHSAGDRLTGASSHTACTCGGTLRAMAPPRTGSMTMTPRPLPAASSSPLRPAW